MKLNILITAGPTREAIDPVRFISNNSTGTMGYTLAAEASRRGHEVLLISGAVSLPVPDGVKAVNAVTARDMQREVMSRIEGVDCVIMAAAVCDFKPAEKKKDKIKKGGGITLAFTENPDILKEIGKRETLKKIGFALETKNLEKAAEAKLKDKDLDLIVGNIIKEEENPFGEGKKQFVFIKKNGTRKLENVTKAECAVCVIGEVEEMFK